MSLIMEAFPKISESLKKHIARRRTLDVIESLQLAESGSDLEREIIYRSLIGAIDDAYEHLTKACDRYEQLAKDALNVAPIRSISISERPDRAEGEKPDSGLNTKVPD